MINYKLIITYVIIKKMSWESYSIEKRWEMLNSYNNAKAIICQSIWLTGLPWEVAQIIWEYLQWTNDVFFNVRITYRYKDRLSVYDNCVFKKHLLCRKLLSSFCWDYIINTCLRVDQTNDEINDIYKHHIILDIKKIKIYRYNVCTPVTIQHLWYSNAEMEISPEDMLYYKSFLVNKISIAAFLAYRWVNNIKS